MELLGPSRPGEVVSHAPGPVADEEVVRVGLGDDGSVRSVQVDQRLVVTGVGDFEMKVLGPATDVEAPPEQSPQPGLRLQTVVWQGFSPGRKELSATVTLVPESEKERLPVLVSVAGDGSVTLRNNTTLPVALATGVVDGAALRTTVAEVRTRLARGAASMDGLPAALPGREPVGSEKVDVTVPVRVLGTVGDRPIDMVLGAQPAPVGSGPLHIRVTGALPPPLPENAGLRELQVAMAQVARLADLDAFVGVTVPGPSTTVYEYAPAVTPPPPKRPPPDEQPDMATVALSALALLGLVAVGRAVCLRA